ncbi:MAG: GNAT family N-acetyltransferase [Pseudomonadota bacterium]
MLDLRRAGAADVATCRSLEKRARVRYYAFPGLEAAAAAPAIAAERFDAGPFWVAEIDATAVGYALAQPLDGALYIASIGVAPEASGRGLGAALMGAVAAEAERLGARAVTLATFKAPPWNGPWFRRHGFAPMPEAEIGPGLRAILDRHARVLDMAGRETLWKPL